MDGQPYIDRGLRVGMRRMVEWLPLLFPQMVKSLKSIRSRGGSNDHRKEEKGFMDGFRLNSSVFFPSPGNWFHLIWELLNHYRSIWHQKKEEYFRRRITHLPSFPLRLFHLTRQSGSRFWATGSTEGHSLDKVSIGEPQTQLPGLAPTILTAGKEFMLERLVGKGLSFKREITRLVPGPEILLFSLDRKAPTH